MVDPREIRIGNVLLDKTTGVLFTVFKIPYINDCDPVPIDENILQNAGFKKFHNVIGNERFDHWKIKLKHPRQGNFILWRISDEFCFDSSFYPNRSHAVKYLHRLQNLFFELTGQELALYGNLKKRVKVC